MLVVDLLMFDLDGTLVDSREAIVDAVNYTLKELGRPERPGAEIVSFIGTGTSELLKKAGLKGAIEDGVRIFTGYFRLNSNRKSRLYPEVKETLNYFKKKRLMIITNRIESIAETTLVEMGIHDFFESIIGGDNELCLKPSPCQIERGIKKSPAGRSLFVGDMDLDVRAGKAAGVMTCGVSYGIGKLSDIEAAGPDLLIDRLGQLRELII